ncbi:hypothetical protein TNIN_115531 [Trichonephila inaurata madagascariensis]|uniref:Uncharacterized protein n=1 Tax=Trichonephila inaurata madagascariensis TaxID=2747483 RepID=A0A8X6XFM2_9ARAC|nr:hypothetical protein TNIN_361861 [Trichonephila inaurata madagascariensis]GFY51807.1 hypothetical protein TNIN_115531 [Trichonephila inaurata madagascariensis]
MTYSNNNKLERKKKLSEPFGSSDIFTRIKIPPNWLLSSSIDWRFTLQTRKKRFPTSKTVTVKAVEPWGQILESSRFVCGSQLTTITILFLFPRCVNWVSPFVLNTLLHVKEFRSAVSIRK